MGAYRELRKLPRGVSIADEFDERVEAARAAADSGDFALYISAQGGQMSRAIVRLSGLPVARRMTLTSTRKKSREWSAFTRRISARVIFISPERRTGALCRKFRSLSL